MRRFVVLLAVLVLGLHVFVVGRQGNRSLAQNGETPMPTQSESVGPTPTPGPSPSESVGPTPTPGPSPSESVGPTPTPGPSPSVDPTPGPGPGPNPEPPTPVVLPPSPPATPVLLAGPNGEARSVSARGGRGGSARGGDGGRGGSGTGAVCNQNSLGAGEEVVEQVVDEDGNVLYEVVVASRPAASIHCGVGGDGGDGGDGGVSEGGDGGLAFLPD